MTCPRRHARRRPLPERLKLSDVLTLSLHLLVNFLRCSRPIEPSNQGTQGLLNIILRSSELPSYVLYICVHTELTSSYPSDRIKRLYDINVHGAFFTAREAAKYMIPQGGGSIILVASMSANVRFMHFWRMRSPP